MKSKRDFFGEAITKDEALSKNLTYKIAGYYSRISDKDKLYLQRCIESFENDNIPCAVVKENGSYFVYRNEPVLLKSYH